MANSFNAAVDLTAVLAGIATVDAVVDAIRATDFPVTNALIVTVDAVVDAIRATDITTITNAITAKNIRGQLKTVEGTTTSDSYEDLLNISGSGKLVHLVGNGAVGCEGVIKVTIDGIASNDLVILQVAEVNIAIDSRFTTRFQLVHSQGDYVPLNIEFVNSLVVEYKKTLVNIRLSCWYIED